MQKIEFTLHKYATELMKFLINLSIMPVIRYLESPPSLTYRNLLSIFKRVRKQSLRCLRFV